MAISQLSQQAISSEKAVTNVGPFTVVGLQKVAGDKIYWMDCLMVKQLGSESFQTAYEYCADRFGRQHRMDIEQVQDPTPLQLSARGNLERMQQLYRIWEYSRSRNCGVNLYVAQRDCIKPNLVNNPNFFKRSFWVYQMQATGRWTFGNDTIAGDNSKTPQIAEDQGQFLPGALGVSMQYKYSQVNAALPGTGFDEMVVVDAGQCAQNSLCGCPVTGGQMIIGMKSGTANVQMSVDGGKTFAAVTVGVGTDLGHSIAAKDGIVIFTTRLAADESIKFWYGVPNATFTGITFTQGTILSGTPTDGNATDPGSIGNSVTDDQYGGLLWAGAGGQVFLSENYGQTWKRIANAVTVVTTTARVVNFFSLNRVGSTIYGVGYGATGTDLIFVHSSNGGADWTIDGYVNLATAPTIVKQYAIGDTNFANVDGVIYKFQCGSVSAAMSPGGFALTNNLIPNPSSANDVLALSRAGVLHRTMDQFATTSNEAPQLGSIATTLAGTSALSAIAYAQGQFSDRILFSHGAGLYAVQDVGSPFA